MQHPLRKAFLFRTTIQYVIKCSLVQMMCFEEVITCCESLHALTFSWEELLGIIGGPVQSVCVRSWLLWVQSIFSPWKYGCGRVRMVQDQTAREAKPD